MNCTITTGNDAYKWRRVVLNVILAFGLIVQNTAASAQPSQDEGVISEIEKINLQTSTDKALTERQVIEFALANSRRLRSLNTNVEIAKYRLNSSGRIRNPELRLSEISSRYYTDQSDELRVGLRWRIPKLGELGEEKQQARVRLSDRRVREIRYSHELIAKVRRSYASVIMYDQLEEIAQTRVMVENERIKTIENLVEFGHRSIVYFTKAKMWHAESESDYARAIQRQGLARRRLTKRAGIAEDTPLVWEELPEIEQDLDHLVMIAYENRPEIDLVQHRIELAVKQNNYERYKLIPWPNFIDISYHIEEPDRRDWAEFRIGISLPFFNWNRGNIKATNLAVKKKEDEYNAIRESIADEIRSAYAIYKDLALDLRNFKRNSDNLIFDANKVIAQAKKHETLMPDEVMEMELTILDVNKLLSEKRRDLAHALIDLYYALGIEGHENLMQPEVNTPDTR